MPDWLKIHDLATECKLGVLDWEKEKPQPIWVDIELVIDARKAAQNDSVQDAVDYAALVALVKTAAAEQAFNLMETLAERLATRVLGKVRTQRLIIRVKKKALPGVDFAAVEIERSNVQPPQPPMRHYQPHPQRRDHMQRGNSMQRPGSMQRHDPMQRRDQPRREFRRFDRSAPPRR